LGIFFFGKYSATSIITYIRVPYTQSPCYKSIKLKLSIFRTNFISYHPFIIVCASSQVSHRSFRTSETTAFIFLFMFIPPISNFYLLPVYYPLENKVWTKVSKLCLSLNILLNFRCVDDFALKNY
jgi:hypothetical protein